MTTHRQARCRHCHTRYAHQASGYGCLEPTNRADYCPDCAQVIIDALAEVPKRVEKVLIETDEADAFELEALSEERYQERVAKAAADTERNGLVTGPASAFGGLVPRRVFPGLYDLEDPSNKDIRGRTVKDGKTYHWNYWTKDPEGTAQVRVAMERNLATGETVPWRDIPRR